MTMIKLDTQLAQEEDLLSATRELFEKVRSEIRDLEENIAEGQVGDVTRTSAEIRGLHGILKTINDTENRIATLQERQAGIAQNGIAFDLDAARASIGSKLDSLRAACSPTAVSG